MREDVGKWKGENVKLRFDTFDASSTLLIMAVSERLVALCVSDSPQSAVASATLRIDSEHHCFTVIEAA